MPAAILGIDLPLDGCNLHPLQPQLLRSSSIGRCDESRWCLCAANRESTIRELELACRSHYPICNKPLQVALPCAGFCLCGVQRLPAMFLVHKMRECKLACGLRLSRSLRTLVHRFVPTLSDFSRLVNCRRLPYLHTQPGGIRLRRFICSSSRSILGLWVVKIDCSSCEAATLIVAQSWPPLRRTCA